MKNENLIKNESGVTLSYQSHFMQNYVTESTIDKGKGIKSVNYDDDNSIVLFINDKSELVALYSVSGFDSGWKTSIISAKDYEVTAFDIYHENRKNELSVCFSQRKNGIAELHVSKFFSINEQTDFDDFKNNLQLETKSLAKNERIINHITMDSRGVLFSSLKEKTDALYHYFKYDDEPSEYTLPENTKSVKQLNVGRIFGGYNKRGKYNGQFGVFILYDTAHERTMLFQGFQEEGEEEVTQRRYSISRNIESFDTVEDKNGNSVLFLAGQGIYKFDSPDSKIEPITEANVKFTKINVAQKDDDISIWAIGTAKDFSALYYVSNNFYTNTGISETSTIRKWTQPIMMHDKTEEFSSIRGKNFCNQLFLFGETSQGETGLIHFWQDAVSTIWKEDLINISDLNSLKEISTYTVDIEFLPEVEAKNTDQLNKSKIKLSSPNNVALYIDNRKYFLPSNTPRELDFSRKLNLMIPTDSIVVSDLKIEADFLDDDITINPTAGIKNILKEKIKNGEDLKNAVKQNGEKLIPEEFDRKTLDEVADTFNKMIKVSEQIEENNGQLKEEIIADLKTPSVEPPQASSDTNFLGVNLGFSFGDVWNSVKKGFAVITEFVVERVKDGVNFIIKIGETAINWIVETAKDVIRFVEKIWEKVKVFFKDLFDFLAFLFDWDDIIQTKRVLKKIGENYLDNMKRDVAELKSVAVKYIMELREKYEKMGEEIDRKYLPANNFNSLLNQKEQRESVDSRVNWFESKRDVVLSNDVKLNTGAVSLEQAKDIKTSKESKDIPAEILDLVIKLIKGEVGFGEFIEKFVNKIALFAIDIAQKIVETVFDLLIKSLDFIKTILYSPIDIPLLGYIYKKVSGDDLSIADFIALVISIPTTIGYKLAYQEAPFNDKNGDEFIAGLQFN